MGEEINIHDIGRAHRLGKCKLENNVPRPIIDKFTKYNVRSTIFKTKEKLEIEKKITALQEVLQRGE